MLWNEAAIWKVINFCSSHCWAPSPLMMVFCTCVWVSNTILIECFIRPFFFCVCVGRGRGGGNSLKIVPVKGKTDTNGNFLALWASAWSKNKRRARAPPLVLSLSNTPPSVIKCDFIPYSRVREAKIMSCWVPGTYPYSPSMGQVTIFNLFSSNIVLLFEEILWK